MCALNPFEFGAGLFQKFGGKFVVTNLKAPQIDTSGDKPVPAPPKPVVPPVKPSPPKLPVQLAQKPKNIV